MHVLVYLPGVHKFMTDVSLELSMLKQLMYCVAGTSLEVTVDALSWRQPGNPFKSCVKQ